MWGCFPLFFHLLENVSAWEVLVQRIIWALIFMLAILAFTGRLRTFLNHLRSPRTLFWMTLSSLLIAMNWLVFIWGVSQHHVLETSLGYFITPLLSLLLGRIVLGERMHPLQAVAGGIATLAVLFELWELGRLPWISLSLATTFALYGLVRKQQPIEALNGLTLETLVLTPIAIAWILWQMMNGHPLAFGQSPWISSLLIASGTLTAIPLLLFAAATRRLDLNVVGFIMYLNPTLQFLFAVFVFEESYPPQRLITFALIWLAMGFFMAGLWRAHRQRSKPSTHDTVEDSVLD
ncbi:permease [Terasakiispira papahanaumokuakeensis]|uniref:Permease n=2 Tax=Terasakiispira papahanaumokuakeensis TaxID=197479 RepID=A0A1E2VB80_9GAMM|nr:permease [Terasakiispira papahanaumokuakeensis]